MQARIANSYISDKQAYKQANYDIKEAINMGIAKQQKVREMEQVMKEMQIEMQFSDNPNLFVNKLTGGKLVANSDMDVENTQRIMKENKYFKQFFREY